jgi:CPA1 family monovalent cation:H+ antiporter
VEYLYILSALILAVFGAVSVILARKLNVPRAIVLILVGIALSQIKYEGLKIVQLSPEFAAGISMVALSLIVFDSSSRLKFKELDTFSKKAIGFSVLFTFLCIAIISGIAVFLFKMDFFLALMLSAMLAQTATEFTSTVFRRDRYRAEGFLAAESIVSTPFLVIIPFLFIETKASLGTTIVAGALWNYVSLLFQQAVMGLGTAVLIGIIFISAMKKRYSEKFSPLALIAAVFITYFIAENINESGIIAVTALGLIFAGTYIKGKEHLNTFLLSLNSGARLVVFLILGLMIGIPLNFAFLGKTILIFAALIAVRYLSLEISQRDEFSAKEKIFMALSLRKGIAAAALMFAFSTYAIEGMNSMLSVMLMCVIYSIISSRIAESRIEKLLGAPYLKKRSVDSAGL